MGGFLMSLLCSDSEELLVVVFDKRRLYRAIRESPLQNKYSKGTIVSILQKTPRMNDGIACIIFPYT
jgi:hypothetical protein